MKNTFWKNQKGFTVIESMIVLLVGIVIIAAAFYAGNSLMSSSNATTEIKSVTTVVNALKNIKGSGGYGTGDLIPMLGNLDAIPPGMAVTKNGKQVTAIKNVFGGDFVITGLGQTFTITSKNIPNKLCTPILVAMSKSGMFSTIDVQGVKSTGEVTPQDANAACNGGPENSIDMTYSAN